MTTAGDLIEETKAHLFSGQEQEENRLDTGGSTLAANATSLTFKYSLGSIARNAIISIGLEDIRVWSTSGNLVADVVERGVNGTTALTHTNLALVQVRPKFSDFRVLRAINQDMRDLSAPANGLFQVKTLDVTFNAAVSGYDMAGVTDVTSILELRWKQPGPTHRWPQITSYSLSREMAVTEFGSGMALFIDRPAFPGLPIRVRYGADFGALSAVGDDVSAVTGLPVSAQDLPPIGAAIRLVAPREINRNFTENQLDPARLEGVPPGAVLQSTRDLQMLRQQRIISEKSRLQSDWPHRKA